MIQGIYLLLNPFAFYDDVVLNPLRLCKNAWGNYEGNWKRKLYGENDTRIWFTTLEHSNL